MLRRRLARLNRVPCSGEIVWSGKACWAVCEPHNWLGEIRDNSSDAQADGERHEREEHARWQNS